MIIQTLITCLSFFAGQMVAEWLWKKKIKKQKIVIVGNPIKLFEFNGVVFYKFKMKTSDGKKYEEIRYYHKDWFKTPDNSWLSKWNLYTKNPRKQIIKKLPKNKPW